MVQGGDTEGWGARRLVSGRHPVGAPAAGFKAMETLIPNYPDAGLSSLHPHQPRDRMRQFRMDLGVGDRWRLWSVGGDRRRLALAGVRVASGGESLVIPWVGAWEGLGNHVTLFRRWSGVRGRARRFTYIRKGAGHAAGEWGPGAGDLEQGKRTGGRGGPCRARVRRVEIISMMGLAWSWMP